MMFLMRAFFACAALALSFAVSAQVLWNTALNPPEEPMPLHRTAIVNADAGAIYVSAVLVATDVSRVRVAKLSPTGEAVWVRWVDGSPLDYAKSLFSHADGSVSQVVLGDNSSSLCVANFTSNGTPRARYCLDGLTSNASVTQAADGDLIFASGDYDRFVSKRAADGAIRWTVTETQSSYRTTLAAQIDSAGNYLELRRGWFAVRRATDGVLISSGAVLDTANTSQNPANLRTLIPRANGEFVFLLNEMQTSNAVVASVARYRADGSRAWLRTVTFPTTVFSSTQIVGLFAEGADDVIVAREGQSADAGSELARLTSAGTIAWQKHLSRVSRIVQAGTSLSAIRTDVGAGVTDSFIFPISTANGSLGTPLIYTRNDAFAANAWFPAANGMIAAFQRDYISSGQFPDTLAATLVFLRPTAPERWVHEAKFRRAAQMTDTTACLMPKLTKSSPDAWWGRSANIVEPNSFPSWLPRWLGRTASDGSAAGRSPGIANGCGFPMADDGGQIVVNFDAFARAKKLTAGGLTEWQVNGQLSPTTYSSNRAGVQITEGSGETTYAVGNLVGRVSASGAIGFEVLTNQSEPQFAAKDSAGNTWVVYSNNTPAVVKVSPTGTVLWTTLIDIPTCTDTLVAARKLINDDILIGTQSCGEGRVFRIAVNGAIAWQRIVSGDFIRPYVALKALAEDTAGNLYAGGCSAKQSDARDSTANSMLVSWTAAGSERWSQYADLAGDSADCVTSIAVDNAGNSISVISAASGVPQLWSISASGAERWRDGQLLSNPVANDAVAAFDETGNLVVLGQSPRNEFENSLVTMRKISLAGVASTQRIKFLQVPSNPIGFRVPFSVRLSLRDALDQPVVAASARVARIALAAGSGNLGGPLTCTIAAGASECDVSGLIYNRVESGVALSAWSDGMPAGYSAPLTFVQAPSVTTIGITPGTSFTAYDVRVLDAVATSPAVLPLNFAGYVYDPTAADNVSIRNCTSPLVSANEISRRRCELLVRTAAFPVTASFVSNSSEVANSTTQRAAPSIAKAQPTLAVIEEPRNAGIAGDRVRFQVKLRTPSSFNLVPYLNAADVSMSAGSCSSTRGNTSSSFDQPDRYFVCEVTGLGAGTHSITFSFAGNDDLLPAQSVTRSVTLVAGAVVRGNSLPYSASVCSPNPGIVCSSDTEQYEWQCTGPVGMSGQVFFIPGSGPYVTPGSPFSFSNVSGVVQFNSTGNWTYDSGSCRLDVDGDGARLAGTDGVIILRRMLGLTGDALLAGATHRCVPLSAAGITSRISISSYDLDGNGQVTPGTDGLMLLRVLLGFQGDAVTDGAIGPNAIRTDWNQVRAFLSGSCSLYLN
ncbi:MAG: hypothetical protein EAZ21_07050 [Betaproteobacteria bacterium]|nr:MAG: hypothetical protein EAZ21_07050 [Betaproteobacteria bacterium]